VPTPEKIEALERLRARLDGMKTAVLAEYRGLTVQQLRELRKQLRAASATCNVVKNRIARRAVQNSPMGGLAPHLRGPTAMVLSKDDPVAVARALQGFARANQALTIRAGYVEGQVLLAPELRALAELPSRDAMRGQLVAMIQGPLARLGGLLQAPLRELVYVLERRGGAKTE
jgi:large subunit ribosomal protein L10